MLAVNMRSALCYYRQRLPLPARLACCLDPWTVAAGNSPCVVFCAWCEFSGNAARHGPVTRDTDTYILGQAGSQPYVTMTHGHMR